MIEPFCPLCGAKLSNRSKEGKSYSLWDCPKEFFWEIDHQAIIVSHYRLEKIDFATEHLYIPPYYIANYNDVGRERSRIYKLHDVIALNRDGYEVEAKSFKLIVQVPLIRPDLESKMLERIKLITTFL